MKTILCYGDSNTWGYVPGSGARYARHQRWTGVLQRTLGGDFIVIEEGLNSRTTVLEDPTKPFKNGKDYLVPCLDSHAPLDLVILMLGTNDLKHRFGMSASDIGANIATLLGLVKQSACSCSGGARRVLLMAPPPVGKLTPVGSTNFPEIFRGAEEKSKALGQIYRKIAQEAGAAFLDTCEIIVSSDVDGIHFDVDEHRKLGEVVASRVKQLLEREE
jgi:lysophospholipase L1-like esterase